MCYQLILNNYPISKKWILVKNKLLPLGRVVGGEKVGGEKVGGEKVGGEKVGGEKTGGEKVAPLQAMHPAHKPAK